MTGWRIGMALGNPRPDCRDEQGQGKYRLGHLNPIQYAAILALKQETNNISKMLDIYGKRRERVLATLKRIRIQF